MKCVRSFNDYIKDILFHVTCWWSTVWHLSSPGVGSLEGNFLAGTLRYTSWPALSKSCHLAASGMGLGLWPIKQGCWPHCVTVAQHPHLVSRARRQYGDHHELGVLIFYAPILFSINKAYIYHNKIPLFYIFDSRANECGDSFSFKRWPTRFWKRNDGYSY